MTCWPRIGASPAIVSLVLVLSLVYGAGLSLAATVSVKSGKLELNGNLEKSSAWPAGITLLVTHGTLSHRDSEIIQTLQGLFLDEGVSSLAINLSLGRNNREGPFDCAQTHFHRHEDAVDELATWLSWLGRMGVEQVVPLGHSRGANQTAWFTLESPSPLVRAQILVAPPAKPRQPTMGTHESDFARETQRARADLDSGQPLAVRRLARFLYCQDASVSAASLVSYYGGDQRMDTRVLLSEGPLPALVVVGSEDETSPGLTEGYSGLADQGHIELLVIDGADHFFRDLYADELVEAAIDFLHGLQETGALSPLN